MIKENLISTSVPYKVGQRLIKVGNSFIPVGFGGNFKQDGLALEESNASSIKFYKCTSVDTINKTWTGYKAVLVQDKTYSFEENVTSGLTFGSGYTPEVGIIYNVDANVKVTELFGTVPTTDGLIFYDPLAYQTNTAQTGQWMSGSANSYTTVNGVACAKFSSNTEININPSVVPTGNSAFTFSIWINRAGFSQNEYNIAFLMNFGAQWGTAVNGAIGLTLNEATNTPCVHPVVDGIVMSGYTVPVGEWHFLAATYDGSVLIGYFDGIEVARISIELNIGSSECCIGRFEGNCGFDGYMASPRIYNRALSAKEIKILSKEHTVTV